MQEKLDWSDLPVLLAFGRTGTLAEAAASLGIDETTAARRLRRLEAALGSPLITKSTGKMALTPVGKLAVERAHAMEDAALLLVRDHAQGRGEVAGTVRITALNFIISHVVLPILPDLLASSPRLTLEMQIDICDLDVVAGDTDIAIRLSAPLQTAGLAAVSLGRMAFAAYRKRSHFEGLPLKRCPWIGLNENYVQTSQGRWLAERVPQERLVMRTNSVIADMAAVKAGIGCAVLPVLLGDNDRDLVRMTESIVLHRDIWLLWREETCADSAIGITIARLKQAFKELAPQIDA